MTNDHLNPNDPMLNTREERGVYAASTSKLESALKRGDRRVPSASFGHWSFVILSSLVIGHWSFSVHSAEPPRSLNREQVIAQTMVPYTGPTEKGVDRSTLTGKIMSGYQGWFAAEGDGCGRGWYHWNGRNGFKPGSCKIDLWPDVSELDADERYATPFKLADGRPAEVFSAFNKKTVLRHFNWMQD